MIQSVHSDGDHGHCVMLFFFLCLVFMYSWNSLRFYVPLKNFSLIWRRHHCRWRAAKFRPMLGTQDLWAERDLYRATPTATRDLGFSGLIRRTALISRLLRLAWGCGECILTRILQEMGNCWISRKLLRSRPPNHDIFCFLCQGASGGTVYIHCGVQSTLVTTATFVSKDFAVITNLPL
jgi:hypothetical protein